MLGAGGHIHESLASRDIPLDYNFWAVSNKEWNLKHRNHLLGAYLHRKELIVVLELKHVVF